jgi:hypothetical protein
MGEFFSRIDPGLLVPLFLFAGLFIWLTVHSLSTVWLKYRKAEMATSLKHEMLARGMSAEEIKTVLEAGDNKPVRSGKRLKPAA